MVDIADKLGADYRSADNQETLIYSILDKQAEVEGNKNPATTKRKRTRITKKDTDHVYTVSGKDGENLDLKKNKPSQEPLPLFADFTPEVKEEETDDLPFC